MKIAFFTSSLGDTDLAKATIGKLIELGFQHPLYIIPLTAAACTRTEDYQAHSQVIRRPLNEILDQPPGALAQKQLSKEDLLKISQFLKDEEIQRAFVGVSSVIDAETPYQIAQSIEIPCTIAYEYMFKPEPHVFWRHLPDLASKKGCQFAVPLKSAENDILSVNSKAIVQTVGHLCIDRAQIKSQFDKSPTRQALNIQKDDELVFISGTTQPIEVDNQFLDAILSELSNTHHANIQVRFGLHPGIANPTLYLKTLLNTCEQYRGAQKQFQIVLTSQMEKKIEDPELKKHPFILPAECTGNDMSQSADKVAQAVPGALLNESALAGKPSYFHIKSTTPYLPQHWFSKNLSTFFTEKPQPPRNPKDLELHDTSAAQLAKLISN